MKSILDYLQLYRDLDFCVIPALPRSKRPAVDWMEYQTRQPSDEEYEEWIRKYWSRTEPYNLGVVCGRVSDGLVNLDFESVEAYHRFFPKHRKLEEDTMTVRTSRGVHVYLRTADFKPVLSFKIPQLEMEVRSEGCFVVLPPCYSEDTEVLTKNGFKHFPELTYNDEIATLNPVTEEIEYYRPRRIYSFPYQGWMIHFRSRSIDLLVTPNHKVFVSLRYGGEFKLIEAGKLLGKTGIRFKRTARWKGENKKYFMLPLPQRFNEERVKKYYRAWQLKAQGFTLREISNKLEVPFNTLSSWFYHGYKPNPWRSRGRTPLKIVSRIPIDTWVRFMGWWIAEGSLNIKDKKDWIISISQTDKRNHPEIMETIRRMGFTPRLEKREWKGRISYNITFHSRQLAEYLLPFWKPKRIPEDLKHLSPDLLEMLLLTLCKGDGWIENGKIRRYYTTSKQLADDITEIAIKCGYAVTMHSFYRETRTPSGNISKGIHYVLNFSKPWGNRVSSIIREWYSGYVYCIEIKNHIIFVRRNGKTCWSGNSIHPSGSRYILNPLFFDNPRILVVEDLVESLWRRIEELGVKKPANVIEKVLEERMGKAYRGDDPPCIKRLLEGFSEGWRNEAAMRLTSYWLYTRKLKPESVWKRLKEWNSRNRPPLDERELRSVLDHVIKYGYRYGCHSLMPFCDRSECKFAKLQGDISILKKPLEYV